MKVEHTVSPAFTAVMPDMSTWSAWHALSSLYTQLWAAHCIVRLSLGEAAALRAEPFSFLLSKLPQHVSSQVHALAPFTSMPLRQQHLSALCVQVDALQLKFVI